MSPNLLNARFTFVIASGGFDSKTGNTSFGQLKTSNHSSGVSFSVVVTRTSAASRWIEFVN